MENFYLSDIVAIILLAGVGLFFIVKGEVPVMKNRVVKGSSARILGGITLLAIPVYFLYGQSVCMWTLILVIALGLVMSQKTG